MANLIKLSNDLEYVPKDQLIQMSQNPNNNYPSYLVLAEIQRRTQNEKAYAAQQPQPETTVAEEVVQEYASSPQGLGAMTQPSGGNLSTPDAEGNMAPPSPMMQAMASGGRTGYLQGGGTGGPDLSATGIGNLNEETIPVESLSESQRAEILQNSQGLTTAQKVQLGLGAASLALLVTPVPGARIAAGATKLLQLGIRGGSGLKGMYQGLRAKRLLKAGQKELNRKGGLPATTPYNPNTVLQTGKEALRRELPYKLLGGTGLGGTTYALLDGDSPMSLFPNKQEIEIETEEAKAARLIAEAEELRIAELERGLARKNTTSETPKDRGNADMLVGLGGAIMKSNTIGELGGNISDSYTNVRNKQDADKLAGLQGRMMEAQITKAETELANMPEQRLIQQYGFIQDAIDAHKDGTSILDEATLAKYIKQKSLLLEQIMAYGNVNLSGSQTSAMAEAKIT